MLPGDLAIYQPTKKSPRCFPHLGASLLLLLFQAVWLEARGLLVQAFSAGAFLAQDAFLVTGFTSDS